MNKILCGNAVDMLKEIPSSSVQMCVTSPPYYGLRDYGADGQIGNEQSPAEYIENLISVFNEVYRVLMPDGTLWVNIADSYAGSGKGIWNKEVQDRPKCKQTYHYSSNAAYANMPSKWRGVKAKDMIGIPWALAFALRDSGWYLRSDIIWHKINCMPEPVKDRPTKSYEHIFLFSKSAKYYYDYEAIQEPVAKCTIERNKRAVSDKGKYAHNTGVGMQKIFAPRTHTEAASMRNKRDVWPVSINAQHIDGHYAIYPEKLIEPCIMAGCPIDGTVLDPFFGSGTTGVVAKRLGRRYIGIDINAEYCKNAQKRIDEQEVQNGNTD